MKKIFEILCIDSKGDCVARNEANLLNRLIGNGKIWKNARLAANQIVDSELGLKLTATVVETNEETAKSSFLVKVEGEEQLEQFRLQLTKHIKDERFNHIYILHDDVSKEMTEKLYPKLYELENLLRKYLTTYFATKFGPMWWDKISNEELNKKVQFRKNNETVFSNIIINGREDRLVDTRAFLIDFDDLGSIIYRVSAGNLKTQDIQRQINELDEESSSLKDAVSKLKESVKTNIKKYFPEFESIGFQEKWEFLYKVRNKIAHNSLFIVSDFNTANEYLVELTEFLKQANDSLVELKFSSEELEIYQETIVQSSFSFTRISKEELAKELDTTHKWTIRTQRPFIGLKYFAVNILGVKGYDIGNTYDLLNELKDEGYIEIYNYSDPSGQHTATPPAIKILKPLEEIYEDEC